jgi:hypothetical protein
MIPPIIVIIILNYFLKKENTCTKLKALERVLYLMISSFNTISNGLFVLTATEI